MQFQDNSYYENTSFVPPEDKIPFSKKDDKWHLKWAQFIYSRYMQDDTGISTAKKAEMVTNREYGEGKQDPSIYETLFYEWDKNDVEKMGWVNLDKKILPIIPIYRNAFIGIMTDINHRITATAIDPFSVKKKNYKKSQIWFEKLFGPELAPIDQKLGLPQKEGGYVPETKEELDMFFELGGYKLNLEAAIEVACQHCFYISQWDSEISNKIYADFFYHNFACARDYVDQETLEVKQSYVDPLNFGCENSSFLDYRDSRYFFEIKSWDLIDIKIATQGKSGWDSERYFEIAKFYQGKNGNKQTINIPEEYHDESDFSKPYNNHKILVMDFEFASIYYDYDTVMKDQYGNERLTKKKFGKVYDDEKRKTYISGTKVWHKGKWIIGTPYMIEDGLQNDIPRPDIKDAKSSFHAYRIPGQSKAELCKGHADQAQLMYLQLQNHISKASPPGLAIEWNSIKNITLAGRVRDPYEILKLKTQRGDVVYKLTNTRGNMTTGLMGPPIMELKGGFSENIIRVVELMEHHKNAIADIIGIPKPTATAQTEKYKSATIAKMAAIGSDKTLKSIYTGYISLYERTAINCTARLRDLLSYSEEAREVYLPIIGNTGIDIFETFEEYSSPASLSIKIEASPSDEDVENMRAMAMAAMKPTKNGIQIFSFGDALLVERLLKAGNIKYVHMFITYKENKKEKLDIKLQQDNMRMNEENALKQEDKKTQNLKEIETTKTDEQIRLERELSRLRKDEETQKHDFRMDEIEKESQLNKQPEKQIA